jgi:hypothetical protein
MPPQRCFSKTRFFGAWVVLLITCGSLGAGPAAAQQEDLSVLRRWVEWSEAETRLQRPEVDAQRIGVTGLSGGGTQTSYIAALDERVVAAAPACYITNFQRLFESIGPQDAEQNFNRGLAEGIDQNSRQEFQTLKQKRLLKSQTAIIHRAPLGSDEFEEMAMVGAKLIRPPAPRAPSLAGKGSDKPLLVPACACTPVVWVASGRSFRSASPYRSRLSAFRVQLLGSSGAPPVG